MGILFLDESHKLIMAKSHYGITNEFDVSLYW